jgi:hypothetical protein
MGRDCQQFPQQPAPFVRALLVGWLGSLAAEKRAEIKCLDEAGSGGLGNAAAWDWGLGGPTASLPDPKQFPVSSDASLQSAPHHTLLHLLHLIFLSFTTRSLGRFVAPRSLPLLVAHRKSFLSMLEE